MIHVTHLATAFLNINGHCDTLQFLVTCQGPYHMVLAIPWLKHHDITLQFRGNRVLFSSEFCKGNCRGNQTCYTLKNYKVRSTSSETQVSKSSIPVPSKKKPLDISMVRDTMVFHLVKKNTLQVDWITIEEVDHVLSLLFLKPGDPQDKVVTLAELISVEYHEFLPLFNPKEADRLPPHRPIDHTIPVIDCQQPPFGPLNCMSEPDLKFVRKYLEKNRSGLFIRSSTCLAGSSIVLAKNEDVRLCLCVDYRGLNTMTVKNQYPFPLIRESMERLNGAKIFTKLNIRGAFNLIRIVEGEEWITTSSTRYGSFEYLVLPFGLTNPPATV